MEEHSFEDWINNIADSNKEQYDILDFEEVLEDHLGEWRAFKHSDITYNWEFMFYFEIQN